MFRRVPLFDPRFSGKVIPWGPETPETDLLQYWNDVADPTIEFSPELSYRPILKYNGSSAGDLRPYQPGRCYLGDGTAYVDCGTDPSLNITDAITLCGWVYAPSAVYPHRGTIIGSDPTTYSNGYWLGWDYGSSNVYFYLNGVYDLQYSGMIYGEWVHFAGTWDGTSVILYVNGVEVYNNPHTGVITNWVQTTLLNAGNGYTSEGCNLFDARVYAEALTPQQILDVKDGKHISGADIRGQWKLDEGYGDICYDSSGNENHGTIINNYPGLHAEQNEYSFQNEVGYSKFHIVRKESGVTGYDTSYCSVTPTTGDFSADFEVSFYVTKLGMGIFLGLVDSYQTDFSSYGWALQSTATNNLRFWENGTHIEYASPIKLGDKVTLKREGTLVTGWVNGVKFIDAVGASSEQDKIEFNVYGVNSEVAISNALYSAEPLTSDMEVLEDVLYCPRNEVIPAQDVLGNSLQYSGRAQGYGALKNLPCSYVVSGSSIEVEKDASFEVQPPIAWFIKVRIDHTSGVVTFIDKAYTAASSPYYTYNSTYDIDDRLLNTRWIIGGYTAADDLGITLLDDSLLDGVHTVGSSFDGTTMRLYLDGVEIGSKSNPGSLTYHNTPLVFGRLRNTALSNLEGSILDFRMYDSIPSPQDVLDIHIGHRIDANLLIHLSLSEGGGNKVYDISGNDNHGQWKNYTLPTIWGTQDQVAHNQVNGFNRRLWFNGTDTDGTFSAPIGVSEACTISARIFFNKQDCVVMRDSTSSDGFILAYDTSGTLISRIGGTQVVHVLPLEVPSLEGAWVTVTIIRTDAMQGIGYVNGIESVASTPVGTAATLNDWHLGKNGFVDSLYHEGMVRDVRVYNRALTPAEVLDIHEGREPDQTGLLAHLPLNDINPPALNRCRTFDRGIPEFAYADGFDYHNVPIGLDITWMSGWINLSSSGTGTTAKYGIFGFLDSDFTGASTVYHHTSGSVSFQGYNTPWAGKYDEWHHVVAMINYVSGTTTRYTVYIDGVQSITGIATTLTVNGVRYCIGMTLSGSMLYLTGSVAETYYGISNYGVDVADREELAQFLYNNGLGRPPTKLQQSELDRYGILNGWTCNESSGVVYDSVGTGHLTEGTLPGSDVGFREHLVEDTVGGNTGILTGNYNWIDQPVAANPEVEPGLKFIPTLSDQIDWIDSVLNFPWAQRAVPWSAAYQYGDMTNGRHINTDDQFARVSYNQGIDRFLNYRENLVGEDLTKAKEYVTGTPPASYSFDSGFDSGFK